MGRFDGRWSVVGRYVLLGSRRLGLASRTFFLTRFARRPSRLGSNCMDASMFRASAFRAATRTELLLFCFSKREVAPKRKRHPTWRLPGIHARQVRETERGLSTAPPVLAKRSRHPCRLPLRGLSSSPHRRTGAPGRAARHRGAHSTLRRCAVAKLIMLCVVACLLTTSAACARQFKRRAQHFQLCTQEFFRCAQPSELRAQLSEPCVRGKKGRAPLFKPARKVRHLGQALIRSQARCGEHGRLSTWC